MSTLSSWLDRNGGNSSSLIQVIEQRSRLYSLYRSEGNSASTGMTRPIGRPMFHQYIEMRIDPARDTLDDSEFVGLTCNPDIKVGDVLRVPHADGSYDSMRVTSVRYIGTIAKVELHYGA